MATVKILYDDDAEHMEEYLKQKQEPETELTQNLCSLEGMSKQYFQIQDNHSSRGNSSIHLIQSWSPDESKSIDSKLIHKMGVDLAERFSPGHQYVVQTHTDQAHYHNHIVINPVHFDSGQRIQNKKANLYKLRELNDEIARENGLSVLPPQDKGRKPGFSDKVKRIDRHRGHSYIMDLADKANFARRHSQNYDQYVAILGSFDIQVRIEPKNITYFYPGKSTGKRGKNLSPALDKPGLEKTFELNLKTPNYLDSLVSKRAEGTSHSRAEALKDCAIPIEELNSAKTKSILRYCVDHKISVTQNEKGQTVLANRAYVELSEYSWTNHRNKTKGNIIDFVANHRDVNYLTAVSILNNNPRLLLIEKEVGEVKRNYQSFYIPKIEEAPRSLAVQSLSHLFRVAPDHAIHAELFKRQMAQVSKLGVIYLFGSERSQGFVEYTPTSQGKYQVRREYNKGHYFEYRKSRSRELIIYTDPKTYLEKEGGKSLSQEPRAPSVLALYGQDLGAIHKVVSRDRNIERVTLLGDEFQDQEPFFSELKGSLDPFSIDTRFAWEPIELDLSQPTNKGAQSPELSI